MIERGKKGAYRRFVEWIVGRDPIQYSNLRQDLISARLGMTAEAYVARAVLISVLFALFFGVLGYLISGLIRIEPGSIHIVNLLPVTIPVPEGGTPLWYAVRLLSFMIPALLAGLISYALTLKYPAIEKGNRATKINLSIHNAVSYIYAMRRGGAEVIEIFRSLSDNAGIYGESALEFRQVVRDADYFGYDVISAIKHLSETTPSAKLKEFLEDLLSIIESGGNMSEFLANRVRLFQDEARFEQKQFISTLEFVGEAYVTVFVAGPLFLVIVMVVMGLLGTGAVFQLSVLAYALIPIGSMIMILFIDLISIKEEGAERYTRTKVLETFQEVPLLRREGEDALFKQLAHYDRIRGTRAFIRNPLRAFIIDARRTFFITVPVALLYLLMVSLNVPYYTSVETTIATVDDHVIIAALIILIPYAVFFEVWRRKVRNMEEVIPEFLSRMAGINQVGLTIAQAIGILVKTNLGVLSYEIKRVSRDISWGANVQDALIRFEHRVRTPTVSRSVTLITTATRMSGNISEILTIAAKDADMSQILRQERNSAMALYLVVIYLAYFVFIFVVVVITSQFLPVLQEVGTTSGDISGSFGDIGATSLLSFTRLLYHTCVIQGLLSGFVAGKMGEGSVRAGAKHAAILLIVALVAFNTLI
ncbi:type II secretion system F family protein [Methanofollis fontis]|uniref:Secretion system protein n=1 Tax=Methanofollis fontis TaxID=2052832 RepID=A0A483CTQ8_9EURY|nr:type II secretion system F family protein [Methanofollis fontis]TAJ45784.1 secretion system protein [Methanofollis fontis]